MRFNPDASEEAIVSWIILGTFLLAMIFFAEVIIEFKDLLWGAVLISYGVAAAIFFDII